MNNVNLTPVHTKLIVPIHDVLLVIGTALGKYLGHRTTWSVKKI